MPKPQKPEKAGCIKEGKTEQQLKNDKVMSKIESSLKGLNSLANSKKHPFDLSLQDLEDLKQHFPQFFPKNIQAKRQVLAKGIEVNTLKQLLLSKIQITQDKMVGLIEKLDRRSEDRITWTEFLIYLQQEGMRRETVGDAQLYGFGIKRLVEKQRFKLLRTKEQQENSKVTEYFIDQLMFISSDKVKILLAVFENNQARLYDATKDFNPIQDIEFPYRMSLHQKTLSRKQAQSASFASIQKQNKRSNAGELVDLNSYLDDRFSDNPYSNMPQSALPNVTNFTIGSVQTNQKSLKGPKISSSVNQSRTNQNQQDQLRIQNVKNRLHLNRSRALSDIKHFPVLEPELNNDQKTLTTINNIKVHKSHKTNKNTTAVAEKYEGIQHIDQSAQSQINLVDHQNDIVDQLKLNDKCLLTKQQRNKYEADYFSEIDRITRFNNEVSQSQKQKFEKLLKKQ